jgi:hypothetical protein
MLDERMEYVLSMLTEEERSEFEPLLIKDVLHAHSFANLMEDLVKGMRRDLELPVSQFMRELVELHLAELDSSGTSEVETNLATFQRMFGLSQLETETCLFLFITAIWHPAEEFFHGHLSCSNFLGRKNLATILGCSQTQAWKVFFGRLQKAGIIESSYGGQFRMESSFVDLLQTTDNSDLGTEFFRIIEPEAIPLDLHNVEQATTNHVLRMLAGKPASSTHVLLYGPPGTGKTSYALGLAQQLGLRVYLVSHGGKEETWKRKAAFAASINVAGQSERHTGRG